MGNLYIIYCYDNHMFISSNSSSLNVVYCDDLKDAKGFNSREDAEKYVNQYNLKNCKVMSRGEIM